MSTVISLYINRINTNYKICQRIIAKHNSEVSSPYIRNIAGEKRFVDYV